MHHHFRDRFFFIAWLPIFALLCTICSFKAGAATPEEIDNAIARGQKFLLSKQTATGGWEKDAKRVGKDHDWGKMQGDSFGGFTSVATYALLASGYSAQSPEITKAIDFLRKADVIGIYALGIRANVWLLLPQTAENATWIRAAFAKDRDLILAGMITKDGANDASGMWEYGNGKGIDVHNRNPRLDHSASQYGVLGLWACQRGGAEVENGIWALIDRKWRQQQFPDGGWAYDTTPKVKGVYSHEASAAMTAAGVATLFITQDYIFGERTFACKGNISNENIERGLDWMGKHFDQVYGNTYALYGVERIGVASGRKYFGNIDWFKEGAERIVHAQQKDGSWDGGYVGATPVPTTSFALLFLARGRAPVIVNKLQYLADSSAPVAPAADGKPTLPIEGNWNQRPRDIPNLVRWTGESVETDLNWQIVNLSVSSNDLSEAPVLYISGDQELHFSAADKQKLRDYVYMGGMILGNPDCASEAFSKSFSKLGTELFGREFRDLPPNHPILASQQFHARKWKNKPTILGLSNGIRELMLMLPQGDPGRAWQMRQDQTHAELFDVGADVFQYAVDKHPDVKGITHLVLLDPNIKADRAIKVARLQLGPNWDPEPYGWTRLANILHNEQKIDLSTEPVKLGSGKLSAFKIAHLTGTTKVALAEDQRAELLEWVRHGGTLIIDAAGGSSDFADSIEQELKRSFGPAGEKGLAIPLMSDHPMFGIPRMAIQKISYRQYARSAIVGDAKIPRIRGIEQGGRTHIFYSREDLTEGLLGQNIDGIYGYSPQTAVELMRNMIVYAASTRPSAK